MKINHLAGVQIELPRSNCTFEESCNRFLKTRKGLQYLLMRYPTLTLEQAIQEYKNKEAEAEFYCP